MPRTRVFGEANGLAGSYVSGGLQDGNGLIWFSTWNGLNCYDGYEFHLFRLRPEDNVGNGSDHLRGISKGRNGIIICHTDYAVFGFNTHTYRFVPLPPGLSETEAAASLRLWRGFTDSQGNEWLPLDGGVIQRVMETHHRPYISECGNITARSFLRHSDGSILVGTASDSMIRTFSPAWSQTAVRAVGSVPYAMYQHPNGGIWTGCKPGLLVTPTGRVMDTPPIYDIKSDRSGRLWLASFGKGVMCCLDPSATSPKLVSLGGTEKVRQLLVTPQGSLIAATTSGLLVGSIDRRNPLKTKFKLIRRESGRADGLASSATMNVDRDSRGNIYIATECSGIDVITEQSLLSATPSFRHLNRQSGILAGDVCKSMKLVGDTLLVVAGDNEVMTLNVLTLKGETFNSVWWGDSCRFTEAVPLPLPDGRCLLGTTRGVAVLDLADSCALSQTPKLVFTTCASEKQPATFCLAGVDTLRMPLGERNVTVGYAALDYVDNSGIIYRTRLDDSPWTAASRSRSVTLFNLSPGEHTLEVEATNRFGRSVGLTERIVIEIPHKWYETWWFRMICTLIALTAAWAVAAAVRYTHRLKRERAELLDKYMAILNRAAKEISPEAELSDKLEPTCKNADDELFLKRVREYIESHLSEPEANIDDMAQQSAVSRATLNRRLRSLLGVSALSLLTEARMQRAEKLLVETDLPIAEIAEKCGYSDSQYFQRVFKKKHDITAQGYREERE